MAKKKETKPVAVEETVIEEKIMVEEPKVRERVKPKNEWEIKDRVYYLKSNKKPISR